MFDTNPKPRTVVSRLAALAAAGLFAFTASALAQNDTQAIVPTRITQVINPDNRVTLQHNVHPLAQARYDQGAAPASMATGRIMLVLKRSDAQENGLKQYLGDLQNPHSANYRKWLTPVQFGQQYGVSDTDLNTVAAWLQSQGFTVDKVPQAHNVVIFSGNIAQIQQAFHTSIHKYVINGETHFANATDPQIPAALAPVIGGIAPLNDFRPRRGAITKTKAHYDPESKNIRPDLTLSDSNGNNYLFVDAADAATIYDTPNSTLNGNYSSASSSLVGGKTYDGTGITIGIAGDSNITPSDITNYRAAFLPSSYGGNQPSIIVDGNDPGITGDAIEALLDLEVSGGIAPGAKVNFYTAADTDFQSGLFLAIYRALDDNNVSILNVSFGACEAAQGTSGNQQILNAWEQAAAQGISVTASTGDSGSAGCDDENSVTTATNGLAISGLASTPYNIAVGGTDFDVLGTATGFAQYVDTTNSASNFYLTAKGYIPETPWNDSTVTNALLSANTASKDSNGNTNIVGAGGGVSSCTDSTTDANGNIFCTTGSGYPQPPFQAGGVVPSSIFGGAAATRAVPDVSLFASDETYGATWVVCADSVSFPASDGSTYTDCQLTNGQLGSSSTFTGVGGTSAAAPAFAAMLALVSQSQGGIRLGQANNVLYNLANQPALYSKIFHDTTTGNNSVVCTSGSTDCGTNGFLTGYNTGTGYDAASGLGSVDVSQLVANWTKASIYPTTTTLQITGFTSGNSVVHGTNLTFSSTVTSTNGTPDGDVSIINDSGLTNNGALPGEFLTLSNGTASGQTGDLPGGTYNVYAYYGGDVNHAGSKSTTPIAVNITPEQSSISLGAYVYDPKSFNTICNDYDQSAPACAGATIPYGSATSINAQPIGASNSNTSATGSISFSDSAGNLTYNNQPGNPISVPIANGGAAVYDNWYYQNQSFSVASHSISAAYSGDPSYQSSSASGLAIKFTQGATTTVAQATQTSTSSTVTLQAQVNTDSIGLAPTGTVTFKNGTTVLGTVQTASATGFVSNTSGQGSTVAALYSLQIPASQITSSVKVAKVDHSAFSWKLSGGLAVACLFLFTVPARRRSWRAILGLAIFALLMSNVIACGSSPSSSSGGGGSGGGGGTGSTSITAVYAGDTNYTGSTSAAVTVTVTQ
ncbi:protease pro-enzyme activation domain-containing protein [Acidobacterium sp. S8]|uniref:protease pro-enzyme activation domain-containing protein n=1 Tax=Acidobacterium sp. S8 TaxID=1641854 RepID=UPI00131D08B0|nr:protease pro-enzyme activation domain-containing protein [Acidobacterium sp. S8]